MKKKIYLFCPIFKGIYYSNLVETFKYALNKTIILFHHCICICTFYQRELNQFLKN